MEQIDEGPGRGEPHSKVTYNIGVNGVAEEWNKEKISYEQVVHLAFPRGPHGGNVRYSVTWTKPDGEEGALRQGQSVRVVNRMQFDVRNTDKS